MSSLAESARALEKRIATLATEEQLQGLTPALAVGPRARAAAIEVCAGPADIDAVRVSLGAREVEDGYVLAGGVRLVVDEMPAGTFGFGDLARGAEVIKVGRSSEVRVAGLLDLLRIAEASGPPAARREALAYQALLQKLMRHDVAFVLIGGAALQSHGRRFAALPVIDLCGSRVASGP